MSPKTLNALKWIVGILHKENIPYQVGGGTATYLYGSGRAVNDIDISLSGKYFETLVPLVQEYVVAGPKHYKNEKWNCATLSLSYEEQDIDLTDADTLLMSKKGGSGWIENRTIYAKHEPVTSEVDGVAVRLMHPLVLLEYKQELAGEHQEADIAFLKTYIGRGIFRF